MLLHCVSHECASFRLYFTFSILSSSRFLGHFFPLCLLKEGVNDGGNSEGEEDGLDQGGVNSFSL